MTKLTHKAAGTFAIAPTPFRDDGRIDDKSIDRLTDFYAEIGCDGVTVLGILGEAPKLEGSEAEEVKTLCEAREEHADHRRHLGTGICRDALAGAGIHGCGCRRGNDRAARRICAPMSRSTGYFKQAVEADRHRHSLGAAGLS